MKNIALGFCALTTAAFINGCVSSGPAPQDVVLQSPDGKAVIIKDIYELPGLESKDLGKTEIVKVFFPKVDNIKNNFSMSVLKISPGTAQPTYKQTSSQIIHALSGGGKLKIKDNIIVLKKGIMVYVPPETPMAITNDIAETLELTVITSPPFQPSQVTILKPAPKNIKVVSEVGTRMDEEVDIQAVSEKYKSEKEKRKYLTVEEYRKTLDTKYPSLPEEKDPLLNLIDDSKKKESEKWPLELPDDPKTSLNVLEKEQREKLMPKTPQKAENVSTQGVQELSPAEHSVPVSDAVTKIEPTVKTSEKEPDSLEKLLKEQEEKEKKLKEQEKKDDQLKEDVKKMKKILPKKTAKVKKTSLEHIQELTPEEGAALPEAKK
jgi:mannose-6-phosphate isomerase-like protein (cupin superfamily)